MSISSNNITFNNNSFKLNIKSINFDNNSKIVDICSNKFSNINFDNINNLYVSNDISINSNVDTIINDISINNNFNILNDITGYNDVSINNNLFVNNYSGIGINNTGTNSTLQIFDISSNTSILLGQNNTANNGSIIKYSESNGDNSSNLLLYNCGDEISNNILCIKNTGYIGIKKINPNYNLDISGNLNINGNLYQNGTILDLTQDITETGQVLKVHTSLGDQGTFHFVGNWHDTYTPTSSEEVDKPSLRDTITISKSSGTSLLIMLSVIYTLPSSSSDDIFEARIVADTSSAVSSSYIYEGSGNITRYKYAGGAGQRTGEWTKIISYTGNTLANTSGNIYISWQMKQNTSHNSTSITRDSVSWIIYEIKL